LNPRIYEQKGLWDKEAEYDPRQDELHRALGLYGLSPQTLHHLVAFGADLNQALKEGEATEEMLYLMTLISQILRPSPMSK
jgi:hypothetical protein